MSFWDERFASEDYIYGEAPNAWVAACTDAFPAGGRVLSLGEGEGRNAVHLARHGLQVTALDGSAQGLAKLARLAARHDLAITPWHAMLPEVELGTASWDGVLNIYCHLPPPVRAALYPKLREALRPGGVFVAELFSPAQLAHESGGPREEAMLVTLAELVTAFPGWVQEQALETTVELDEGSYHQGPAAVTRVVFRKP